jgi:hypothetical protein
MKREPMPKQQALRGERGIPGPVRRQREVGAIGKTGTTGVQGATGECSPVGTVKADRNQPSGIHEHIDAIYHELDIQMKRMAQLQVQVDEVRSTLQRIMGS